MASDQFWNVLTLFSGVMLSIKLLFTISVSHVHLQNHMLRSIFNHSDNSWKYLMFYGSNFNLNCQYLGTEITNEDSENIR